MLSLIPLDLLLLTTHAFFILNTANATPTGASTVRQLSQLTLTEPSRPQVPLRQPACDTPLRQCDSSYSEHASDSSDAASSWTPSGIRLWSKGFSAIDGTWAMSVQDVWQYLIEHLLSHEQAVARIDSLALFDLSTSNPDVSSFREPDAVQRQTPNHYNGYECRDSAAIRDAQSGPSAGLLEKQILPSSTSFMELYPTLAVSAGNTSTGSSGMRLTVLTCCCLSLLAILVTVFL